MLLNVTILRRYLHCNYHHRALFNNSDKVMMQPWRNHLKGGSPSFRLPGWEGVSPAPRTADYHHPVNENGQLNFYY